jgi:chemotaxis protein CheC
MNDKKQLLSAEQVDFLTEMMNIGAGHAATALTQVLQCRVDIVIPRVFVITDAQELSILTSPSLPVVCARMGMVGDVSGGLFLIVPEEQKEDLIRLAERAVTGTGQSWRAGITNSKADDDLKLSVIAEIGNIVAGVYLTAVHDFCKLNIYHTVPTVATDMVQALLDESLVRLSRQVQHIIVIENEFMVKEKLITTFLVMVPSVESVDILVNSIGQARMAMVKDGG